MTDDIPDFTGITRRDYFAAHAMQAFISDQTWSKIIIEEQGPENMRSTFSKVSVEMADALIAELDKK